MENGGGEKPICAMSQAFMRDVREIARRLRAKAPVIIPHIRKIGVRTVALRADATVLGRLVPPYSRTGFFLVPVVRAWTMTTFWVRRGI